MIDDQIIQFTDIEPNMNTNRNLAANLCITSDSSEIEEVAFRMRNGT